MSFGRTRKYGTRVPSFEVAKCCSMASFDPSKNCGIVFSVSGASLRETSASIRLVGVR
jgi:hypothetical protein